MDESDDEVDFSDDSWSEDDMGLIDEGISEDGFYDE